MRENGCKSCVQIASPVPETAQLLRVDCQRFRLMRGRPAWWSDGADRCYPETLDQPSISQQDGSVLVASHSSSLKVIYAALAGNLAIAVTKFAAAAVTGSSAMLSEAIHSTVDTGNELLLMFGMSRAERPAKRAPVRLWVAAVFLGIRRRGADLRLRRGFLFSSRVCARSPTRRRSEMFSSTISCSGSRSCSRPAPGTWHSASSASRPTDEAGSARCGAARIRPSSPCCSRNGGADRSCDRIDRHRARRNSANAGARRRRFARNRSGAGGDGDFSWLRKPEPADRRGGVCRSAAGHRGDRPRRAGRNTSTKY